MAMVSIATIELVAAEAVFVFTSQNPSLVNVKLNKKAQILSAYGYGFDHLAFPGP